MTEAIATKPYLKGGVHVGSFMFDDIMMATYQRGQSVETFFCRYGKLTGFEYLLNEEDFNKALSTLNVEWSGNPGRLYEFFNSLDLAAH